MAQEFGDIRIMGGKELAEVLGQMPARAANNVMRGALYAGAVEFRDEARLLAPVGHPPLPKGESASTLRHSIVAARGGGEHGRDQVSAKVHLKKEGWYGRLVEFGHRIAKGGTLGRGRRRGHIVGFAMRHPFMRPAFDAKREAAVSAIAEYANRRINAGALTTAWSSAEEAWGL